jgi:anti-sigma factor RsiW
VITCDEARPHLLDYQARRLEPAVHEAVRAHLEGCRACAHDEAAEQALTELLERQLPQHPAPIALKRRLAAAWREQSPLPAPIAPRRPRWLARALSASAVGLVALLVLFASWRGAPDLSTLATEAVNDHLRVVQRLDRLPVASANIHHVKPWFTGQIDFAPVVRFPGDGDFPLRGGAVERFLDREAAVLIYGRRQHTISLLVFRADGLTWPRTGGRQTTSVRGFNVIVWRAHDLGYALVSDVDARDLAELARRLGSA